jgi:hypothetical protein
MPDCARGCPPAAARSFLASPRMRSNCRRPATRRWRG